MSKKVLAIDIGSNKICAIIAQIEKNGNISVIGAGISASKGLKKGSITNIELASKSIEKAVDDAKRISGSDISKAVISLSSIYTKSVDSQGIVNLTNKEITIKDIERVMQSSLYNATIPNEYEVVHALPYEFKVDEQEFIEDPLGMNASRLEVKTHIITAQKSNLNNLKKALKNANLEVENIILSGYASSIATLNDDEKELGVAVIDMGGSSCNLVIHSGNAIRYNDFLGVGSNHITNDLSMALHTPLSIADEIKHKYGSLTKVSNDSIEVPKIGDDESKNEISLEVVHNVIYARVEETLMILAKLIDKSGLKDTLGAGVVLTGGFSKIDGLKDFSSYIFDPLPVRVAKPKKLNGLFEDLIKEEFSCAIGLVLHSAGEYTKYEIDINKRVRHPDELIIENNTSTLKDDIKIEEVTKNNKKDKKIENNKIDITNKANKDDNSVSGISKFWNWARELF